jgi:hypothetical protein
LIEYIGWAEEFERVNAGEGERREQDLEKVPFVACPFGPLTWESAFSSSHGLMIGEA